MFFFFSLFGPRSNFWLFSILAHVLISSWCNSIQYVCNCRVHLGELNCCIDASCNSLEFKLLFKPVDYTLVWLSKCVLMGFLYLTLLFSFHNDGFHVCPKADSFSLSFPLFFSASVKKIVLSLCIYIFNLDKYLNISKGKI